MKRIICILFLACLALQISAQVNQEKKPSTLAFHVFYNDFKTVEQIRTGLLKQVINNGQWRKIGDMQMGFGFNYLKGISKKIDAVATLDGSSTDYLFRNGTSNGSSKFLLDANAMINIKLFTDRHAVVPYFTAGTGFSFYNGKAGYYIPAGAGIQFNLFSEAFIFAGTQARFAISPAVNHHFQHSIGIGTSIGKKKKINPPVNEPIPIEAVTVAREVTLSQKNIIVRVTDEQTRLPLPGVEIMINGPDGKINAFSDADGRVNFNAVQAADYTLSGLLHGISTTSQNISKNSFDVPGQEISISISHNDLRFTLAGRVQSKSSHNPEGGVEVSVVNTTTGSSFSSQSKLDDGSFSIPLEVASDFTVSGKKAGYISNIEKVSTKRLNRSTTLYVKLELDIEEAGQDKIIALTNIYYDTGSSRIRSEASSDLEKLTKFLKDNPGFSIEIASHSDSRGSDASNLILSQARAQEVVNYLQKSGIPKNRLIPMGYGETRLVNDCTNGINCTEAQHEQNRRTEFKVTSN